MARHSKSPPLWVKGKSGNPNGGPGPSGTRITQFLVKGLDDTDAAGRTKSERIANAVLRKALRGDLRAVDHVSERTEGKVLGRIELTGSDGGPLEFADARSRLLGRLARKPAGNPTDPQ